MCDGKKQTAPDFYDWIVSQEIRDYLRKNHRFSFQEKIQLICGACRPVEEKYHALRTLWEESEGEEKVLAGELVKLHDWAFDQLYRETPGQVFVFMEEQGCDTGEHNTRYRGVDQMFRTYEELAAHIQEREGWYREKPPSPWNSWGRDAIGKEAFIEKWIPVDGKMTAVIAFSLFHAEGRLYIQRFFPWWLTHGKEADARAGRLGISEDAMYLYDNDLMNDLPLPFQTGDLVRLETPDWDGPLYGVLGVFEALGRYINIAYIKDGRLEMICLRYWWIDVASNWQTIDWLRHAEPAEFPPGQEVLVEMAEYLCRLEQENVYAAEEMFYDIVDRDRSGREIRGREVYRTPEPIPFQEVLEEALEEVRKEERLMWEKMVKGAVLGLVVGDALGVPVEFMSRAELDAAPVTGMRAYGTHCQPAGTWSDDSSMALCLLESLTSEPDYEDMMARFLRWADEGYMTAHGEVFDMGIATRKALMNFVHGTPALECGGNGAYDNGNGSLMRILPMALYLHRNMGPEFPDEPEAYQIIRNASALTHAHPISLIGCGIYCAVANELLCGGSGPEDIQRGIAQAKVAYFGMPEYKPYLKEYRRVDADTLLALPRTEVKSSGYVVHTLEAALWCLLHTDSYRSCLLEAVNLGEDTDTVGAVAGGLAGIRYGIAGIPKEWLSVIAKRNEIEALCERFATGSFGG